jgi:hypothetical protein
MIAKYYSGLGAYIRMTTPVFSGRASRLLLTELVDNFLDSAHLGVFGFGFAYLAGKFFSFGIDKVMECFAQIIFF